MGPGLANTEANLVENERSMGFVTKSQSTKFKSFQSLDTAEVAAVSGPFEWVAVKSKYFVTAVLAFETGGGAGRRAVGAPIAAGGPEEGAPGVHLGQPPAPGRPATSATSCTPGRWSTPGWPRWGTTSTT